MSNAQFVGLWGLVAAIYTQESIFISLGFYFIACMAGAISLIVLRLKCVRQCWRNSDGEIKEEKLYGFEHMPATYCGPSQLSERALIENLNPIAPKGEVQAPVRATCKLCLLPSVSCWNIDGGYICLSCFDYESETESDLEAAPEAVEEN